MIFTSFVAEINLKMSSLEVMLLTVIQSLAEACRFVYNDTKYVDQSGRNHIILLARYIPNHSKLS